MAHTVPPGNPFSVPQLSCKYCDTLRCGSSASPWVTKYTAAPAITPLTSQCFPKPCLREIFEFLNDNLGSFFHRVLLTGDHVQDQLEGLRARRRYSGREHMLGYRRSRPASSRPSHGLETRSSRFPSERMRQRPRRCPERRHVTGHIERLNSVPRIHFAGRISPPADFHVHLTVMLFASPIIEGVQAQNCGRLELRSIVHRHHVCPVSQAVRQLHLRARPLLPLLLDSHVQQTLRIGPSIVAIVQIVHPSPIAGDFSHQPVVPTEMHLGVVRLE